MLFLDFQLIYKISITVTSHCLLYCHAKPKGSDCSSIFWLTVVSSVFYLFYGQANGRFGFKASFSGNVIFLSGHFTICCVYIYCRFYNEFVVKKTSRRSLKRSETAVLKRSRNSRPEVSSD